MAQQRGKQAQKQGKQAEQQGQSNPLVSRTEEAVDGVQEFLGSRAGSRQVRSAVQHPEVGGVSQSRSWHPLLQAVSPVSPRVQAKPLFCGVSQEWSGASSTGLVIQPKLMVGAAGDQYEQEADRVAAAVVKQLHAPTALVEGQAVRRETLEDEDELRMKPMPLLQREAMDEDDELQLKPLVQRVGAEGGSVSADLEGEINRARGGGQPLAPELQAQMGQAMGADFSGVRVHTDGRADGLNRSVGARAFTTGQDLFFKRGEYQPGSWGGQELIAHELTHVVQQRGPGDTREFARRSKTQGVLLPLQNHKMQMEDRADPKAMHQKQQVKIAANDLVKSSVIQRTIWHWHDEIKEWKVDEYGTAGEYKLPSEPESGIYFNDVTGKQGQTIEEVRAGLLDRMMQTGSVLEFLGDGDSSWEQLEGWLDGLCKARGYGDTVKAAGNLLEIGTIRLTKEDGKVADAKVTEKKVPIPLINEVKTFVIVFMRKNGQLAYIERQPWFRNGSCDVDIDLNYYYSRSIGETGEVGMHKDTGGDNIFVNIIFNNTEESPATEWTQDREKPAGDKKTVMDRLMPKELVKEITLAKGRLDGIKEWKGFPKVRGHDQIEGGKMPRYGYVSWVDELIWHATPTLAHRQKYAARHGEELLNFINPSMRKQMAGKVAQEETLEYLKYLLMQADDKSISEEELKKIYTFFYKEKDKQMQAMVYESLSTLIEDEKTKLSRVWQQQKERLGPVFTARACEMMLKEIHTLKEDWVKGFYEEIRNYKWADVKRSGRLGEETAYDPRVGSASSVVPTGVMSRKRVNSDDEQLLDVRRSAMTTDAEGKEIMKKRSFLRTWVRVVKRGQI